jgi:sortase A
MNKAKSSRSRSSFVTILSLGSLVLGTGCICWALVNIGVISIQSTYAYSSPASIPTTSVAGQVSFTGDNAATVVPDHSSKETDPDKGLYPVYPKKGDNIGSLTIPALKQKLPIIQGTGTDDLKKGIGHFIQSVLPGEKDNCVLSGHRDTVFAKLGKLKIDDNLIVQTSAGTYTYKIKRIRIVDKNDKTVIVPADHAVLTLSTCYPFHYIGSAPKRYILIADLAIKK